MKDKFALARSWFRKADSDLDALKRLLEGGGPFDTACFHAQQAVEKYVKGLLAQAGRPFPFTHDLEELQRIGTADVPGWPLTGIDLSGLTAYAVELRYDFDFWPDRETASQALDLAQRVRTLVLAAAPGNSQR